MRKLLGALIGGFLGKMLSYGELLEANETSWLADKSFPPLSLPTPIPPTPTPPYRPDKGGCGGRKSCD